jgi:DNA-binding MarR family transcriptional regulator
MPSRPARSRLKAAHDVRDLLMFRVARLATIGDRTGQFRISRQFGLNLGEWRVLSVIHALSPVTLADVARELYLDKGQLSRTVSILIDGGLVSHSASRKDRRQTLFEPTGEGRRLHDRVLAFVIGRNMSLMGSLAAREQAELIRLLEKVTATAADLYDELFKNQPRPPAGRQASSNRPLLLRGTAKKAPATAKRNAKQEDFERPRARTRGS